MTKALVVDDEELVRTGLRKTLVRAFGTRIAVDEAADGTEAVEKIRRDKPDIVVTDIRMQHMDGLDMIERVRRFAEDLPFVIISGYEDFGYARRAIRYGVEDYLLKPLDEAEFLGLIGRLLDGVEERRSISEPNGGRRTVTDRLKRMLTEDFPIEDFSLFEASLGSRTYRVGVVLTSNDSDPPFDPGGLVGCLSFENSTGETIVLIGCPEEDTNSAKSALEKALGGSPKNLRRWAGLSRSAARPEALRNAYQEAVRASYLRFCRPDASTFEFDQLADFTPIDTARLLDSSACLARCFAQLDPEDASSCLRTLFAEFASSSTNPAEFVRGLKSLLNALQLEVQAREPGLVPVTDGILENFDSVSLRRGLPELESFMSDAIRRIFGLFETREYGERRMIIERAKEYILSHPAEELTLGAIAARVKMSGAYFSYLFKKETGSNFVDFVTSVKLEKAARMIQECPELRIYEVAARLGYKDVKYFNRLFKKRFLLTPGEYREVRRSAVERKSTL